MAFSRSKPTFDSCPNTIISTNSRKEANVVLAFSCPRVPKLETQSNYADRTDSVVHARKQLAGLMGNMCTDCAFRSQHFSPTTESSMSPDGGIVIEIVNWQKDQDPTQLSSTQSFSQPLK